MVVGEFLFLFKKSLKSRRLDLLSNHEICFQNFSFSSRNWRKLQISRFFLQNFSFSSGTRKQISTFLFSLLEIRDIDFIFLFLFSLGQLSQKVFLGGASITNVAHGEIGGNDRTKTLVRKVIFMQKKS